MLYDLWQALKSYYKWNAGLVNDALQQAHN